MDIQQRTLVSSLWQFLSRSFGIIFIFIRGIFVVRLLEIQEIGIYAFAISCVHLFLFFSHWGIGSAFINQVEETSNENRTANVHFSLQFILAITWFFFITVGVLSFASDNSYKIMIVVALCKVIRLTTSTPILLLKRNVLFKSVAKFNFWKTIFQAIVVVIMAWNGFGIWSLVAGDITEAILDISFFFMRPVKWKPHFLLDYEVVRYFIAYSTKISLITIISTTALRLDKIAIQFFYSETLLGIYSTAQRFSMPIESLLNQSINVVSHGSYTKLKKNPQQLTEMFYYILMFLIRIILLGIGFSLLVLPEITIFVLGEKWAGCIELFPLVMAWVGLRVLTTNTSVFFHALNIPEKIYPWYTLELIILIIGIYILHPAGLIGIALAKVLSLFCAWLGLLITASTIIKIKWVNSFFVPILSFIVAIVLSLLLVNFEIMSWGNMFIRGISFIMIYLALSFVLEFKLYLTFVKYSLKLKYKNNTLLNHKENRIKRITPCPSRKEL